MTTEVVLQKHRSFPIKLRLLLGTVLAAFCLPLLTPTAAIALEAGCSGCSEAELLGCQSDGYTTVGTYPLRDAQGDDRNGIGYLHVLKRQSPSDPSNTRWCVMTKHGSTTYGEKLYTYVRIGSRDQGSTSNTITWYYSDGGDFATFAGGVALTPGEGRCPVFYGKIVRNGNTFQRTLNGSFTCN